MTLAIVSLAAQIQRWVNRQVARHLEARAAELTGEVGPGTAK